MGCISGCNYESVRQFSFTMWRRSSTFLGEENLHGINLLMEIHLFKWKISNQLGVIKQRFIDPLRLRICKLRI